MAALSLILVQADVPSVRADVMPRPQATPRPAAPRAAEAPAEAPPAESGLLMGPATIPAHWSRNKCPDTIPEGASYYIIVKGDTLWDISRRFLRNPFLWPQIWDRNRCITDAHWIYPGDALIMPDIAMVSDRAGEGIGMEDEPLPSATGTAVIGDALIPAIEDTALQCAPYVVSDREDESLYVIGNEEGAVKNAFGDRDILYLSKGSNSGVKAGDVYFLQHRSYTVKHPDSGKAIGTKIEVTGWARVILVQEDAATVMVEQACADIHAGDYLRPFERLPVPLIPRHLPPDRLTPVSGKTIGTVVDIQDDAMIAGDRQLVVINLGTANGVAPGNLLTVYKVTYPSVPSPRNVIGELAIVSVRERTAIARVIYSRDAIMNGDKAELR